MSQVYLLCYLLVQLSKWSTKLFSRYLWYFEASMPQVCPLLFSLSKCPSGQPNFSPRYLWKLECLKYIFPLISPGPSVQVVNWTFPKIFVGDTLKLQCLKYVPFYLSWSNCPSGQLNFYKIFVVLWSLNTSGKVCLLLLVSPSVQLISMYPIVQVSNCQSVEVSNCPMVQLFNVHFQMHVHCTIQGTIKGPT